MHDAESVRGDGRRHLLQRRLAATWHDAAKRRIDDDNTTTDHHSAADNDLVVSRNWVHDAGSVRVDGRRCVLQGRLAATVDDHQGHGKRAIDSRGWSDSLGDSGKRRAV